MVHQSATPQAGLWRGQLHEWLRGWLHGWRHEKCRGQPESLLDCSLQAADVLAPPYEAVVQVDGTLFGRNARGLARKAEADSVFCNLSEHVVVGEIVDGVNRSEFGREVQSGRKRAMRTKAELQVFSM